MSEQDWQDRIVGARLAVDQSFNERLQSTSFSNQQWGLIMTATEIEIENPENPEEARLVANTEKLPQIMPEVENVRSQMGMGGGQSGGAGGSESGSNGTGGGSSGGIIDSIMGALGLGSGGASSAELAEAEELTQEYVENLQDELESRGQWESVCAAAAD